MLFRVLVCLVLISRSLSVDFIRFEKLNAASGESLIFLTDDRPTAILDASATQQRTVYFAQRSPVMELKLTFSCLVNNQRNPLQKISLCCRSSMEDPKRSCVPLSKVEGTFSCLNTDFQFTVDERKGANFSTSISRETHMSNPISGFFSCVVAADEFNIIESNEIEIRDAVFYIRQLKDTASRKIDVVAPIPLSSFPHEFRCSDDTNVELKWPYWMHQLDGRYGPYRWKYCSATGSPNAVTCAEKTAAFPPDTIVTYVNGSVYLTDPNFIDKKSVAIVCTHLYQVGPIKTFAGKVGGSEFPVITGGLSIDKNVMEPSDRELYPLTALSSEYVISKGSRLEEFVLKALYRQPQGDYEFHWFKDEQLLPKKAATKYSYQLPNVVDESVSGMYSLVVKSNTDVSDRLVFTYDVKVVSPPVFKDPKCLKELFYVMENNNFGTVCEFDDTLDTAVYVGVASLESTSSHELRRSIEDNFKYSRQQLSQLDIDFHLDGESTNRRITINITSLKLGQDCELSVRLSSKYGHARISTSIKVVPKPQLTISPSNENCIKECDEKPYNVSCGLNENVVQEWKSRFNIEPSVDWIIQNQWTLTHLETSGLGQFITVIDGHDSTLTVWPEGKPNSVPTIVQNKDVLNDEPVEVKTGEQEGEGEEQQEEEDEQQQQQQRPQQHEEQEQEQMVKPDTHQESSAPIVTRTSTMTLKQFLAQKIGGTDAQPPKDLILSCWIRLSVINGEAEFDTPSGLLLRQPYARQAPMAAAQSSRTNRFIYDSRWETDSNLAKQLTATRTFTPDIVPTTASLAWIAAVILGVIIVIVVIALSIWLCTRDRGETYMVYDKERAHGNDPIQELKEKETFQTFQRQEEPRIATSRYSLNDGSVRFESEDDGELDDYADNFNEEASFLGQYSGIRSTIPKSSSSINNTMTSTHHQHQPTPILNNGSSIVKEISPELSTMGGILTTATTTSDSSDLLLRTTSTIRENQTAV
ncbi:unnamed protein product [Trichobilharzia szidati]|nr:unnamed protein product [Trichobilharzia szidati]